MIKSKFSFKEIPNDLGLNLFISSSYFLLALFGFYLATLNKSASPIWLASGLSLVALIQFGPRISIGIYFGAFLSNFYNGSSFLLSSLISSGNLAEALAAYALYRFFKSKPNYFGDLAKTLVIVTLSLTPTLISAIIGICSLMYFDLITTSTLSVFITWWIGDAMGILIILPLYLHFIEPTASRKMNPDISNIVTKFWLYCIFTVTFTTIFFFPTDSVYSMFFYPFLLLSIWICGERTTYVFAFLIAIIGSILTSYHLGPFAEGETNSNLIKFQFFITSITLTTLILEYLFRINEIKWSSLALIGSWILTGFTFYAFNSAYDKEKHKEFLNLTEKAQLEVQKKLDLYFSLLESGVGLYAASDDVSVQDWKQFVTTLNLKDKYPGLHGLGVIFEVPDSELKSHAAKFHLNIKTFNDDQIVDPTVNWSQQSHYIITYVEPLEFNRAALGLDIASEKNRREAANLAKKFKSRTMTRAIHLVQDNQNRNGFLIFSPFFKDQQTSGFIYAPVILEQFLNSALISYNDKLNLSVYSVKTPEDEESLAKKTLLYSSQKEKFLKYKKSNTL
ncbi:MAG: CHASE domain-containing protein, partial [Bdellovibrionaceae bacterium]|nr:CHASE domain-containing protein [Pseudobdellovibrionaceae bacterium]